MNLPKAMVTITAEQKRAKNRENFIRVMAKRYIEMCVSIRSWNGMNSDEVVKQAFELATKLHDHPVPPPSNPDLNDPRR